MTESISSTSFADAHAAWHAQVEAARVAPYGPLSVTALHWLTATPTSLPGLPGIWSADADGVATAVLAESDGVSPDGAPLSGEVRIGPLTGIESTTIVWGEIQIEVAARSGALVVRPRDPAAQDRIDYAGTNTFPADERWAVTARFAPAEPHIVEVGSAAGEGRTQHYESAGSAEFEIDGQPVALTLFGSPEAGNLRALFADATGGDLTYPAVRFVGAQVIDADTVRIDFNRATNPPCAYSDAATCPFPPTENRLDVRIEAGELRPGVALSGA
ncbi:DUF1684 domain-containing protein [Leucobacter musarum]|uniref:DUF1684 domain-containing protein n=1 Tax=Leucobacter musarum TaxID=1930747 RepID=UPI0006A7CA16|nr:DUF1684 domain-containing protein [Leucobacter musarum]